MKLTETLPLLFSVSAATATKVFPRSLASSGTDFASRSYDYVIIGGGTAGLTVAARLTEDPNVSVGVIEAGEYLVDDAMIDTPANAFQLQGNPKYDWNFQSVPQPNVNGRALNLPRGKVLGGSSAINIMVLDRASKVEYDSWEGFGNPGWNWNGLLPYMKAAEHFTGADPFRVNNTGVSPSDILPSQGTNGPIAASYNSWYSDIIPPFHKTMKNLGVPMNFDPDSGDPFGTYNSPTAVNRTTGKRSYAASTYYAYNAHRSNLVVLTGAHATKIQFDTSKTGGKVTAKGVSFTRNSTTYSVSAKKEVILSAGSFQTPQLLELSGIGDSTILRKFGITPLVDLPGVGENLQDHTYLATNYELKPGFTTLDILQNNATYAAEAAAQYATTHDGIFAVSGSIVSFIDLDFLATPLKIASMTAQLLLEIVRDGTNALQKLQYAFQLGWLAKNLGQVEIIFNPGYAGGPVPKAGTSYAAILLAAQHPFSRGSVHINSSDPLAPPRIDPQYFSKSFDLDVFVQAVKLSSKIAKTEPLASAIVGRVQPAPEVTSDDDITQYIKDNVQTIYHPIGTAVMAPQILGGVVDPNLKVYGTSNLRVIDASIIPTHMGTHLQRTVYGIAEKAAEIIKKGSS